VPDRAGDVRNRGTAPWYTRLGCREQRSFSLITVIGSPLVSELTIESFYPADAATTEAVGRKNRELAVEPLKPPAGIGESCRRGCPCALPRYRCHRWR
jgi:hypothetical protein